MPEYAEIFCEKGRSAVLSVFFRFVLRIRKGKEMDSFECMRKDKDVKRNSPDTGEFQLQRETEHECRMSDANKIERL